MDSLQEVSGSRTTGTKRMSSPEESPANPGKKARLSTHDVELCKEVKGFTFDHFTQNDTDYTQLLNLAKSIGILNRKVTVTNLLFEGINKEKDALLLALGRVEKQHQDEIAKAVEETRAPMEKEIKELGARIRVLETERAQTMADSRQKLSELEKKIAQQASQIASLTTRLKHSEAEKSRVQGEADYAKTVLSYSLDTATEPLVALAEINTLSMLLPACSLCKDTIHTGSPLRHERLNPKDKPCNAYFHKACVEPKLKPGAKEAPQKCSGCGDQFYTKESGKWFGISKNPAQSLTLHEDHTNVGVINRLNTIRHTLPEESSLRADVFQRKNSRVTQLVQVTERLSQAQKTQPGR